jgi:hypothetical protein
MPARPSRKTKARRGWGTRLGWDTQGDLFVFADLLFGDLVAGQALELIAPVQ